jgi:hypothetical protein
VENCFWYETLEYYRGQDDAIEYGQNKLNNVTDELVGGKNAGVEG